VLRRIIFLGLKSADRISIATKIGASEFPEFLRQKIRVISGYRPIIPAKFPNRGTSDDTFRFVYAGAISEEKGIDVLLKSFSEFRLNAGMDRPFELHIYGRGSGYLEETLVKKKGVYYHGEIDNIELRRQLASYNVFVFPSVYDNEGHPGVLIEALMAGLPIISSDQPVIREFLFDKFNCLLVEPGDIHGFSEAMDRLAKDHSLRQKLSKAALETSSMFNAANVFPELAKAFGF
jgi:glycosyltransferase involved in cell wall biosynthesis